VNYIETVMSASIWQASTSATTAYYFRQLLNEWALKTTGSTDGVEWQGHDFSFRGMAGSAAAAASGAGHLLSFTGSDNLNVVNFVNENYAGDNDLILGSVPATEHSVMCAGGSDEGNEQATYERLLSLYPSGIVSVVSDTWDLWNVLTVILPNLKDQILARDGKLVIRPDSGDPVDIICGTWVESDKEPYDSRTPAQKGVIELLWETFGGTINDRGFRVLDPHIGAIYGDSITYERAEQIFTRLARKGFASTNIVLGVGSYTYQYVTRDTFASAVKATWVEIDGVGRDIAKDPITDNGTKKSAKGRLAVLETTTGIELFDGPHGEVLEGTPQNMLQPVWADGKFIRTQSFANVRKVLAK
jgi:nicotinamide phosphoribosyltransferase